MRDLEIITVNYNTPDLLKTLIYSIRDTEENYPIRIIDGSDTVQFRLEARNVCDEFSNVDIEPKGFNIHHGPGMDLALSTSKAEWCLIIDTDNVIKKPIIDKFFSYITTQKICGTRIEVNEDGYNVEKCIPYFHPQLMFVNVNWYKSLREKGITFVKHGAPCIEVMKYLYDKKISDKIGVDLCKVLGITMQEIDEYSNLKGRGTVKRFGYNL